MMSKTDSPIYVLKLRPAPGADDVKVMRWVLKSLWRRYRLRCVSISVEQDQSRRPATLIEPPE